MFEGTFIASIDRSGRITLPPLFREVLKKTRLIITKAQAVECNREFHRGLMLFQYREWQDFKKRIKCSSFDKNIKGAIKRQFLDPAAKLVIDKRGRILISKSFRCYCNLDFKQEVVIVGLLTSIELWNKDSWEKVEPVVRDRLARLIEKNNAAQ